MSAFLAIVVGLRIDLVWCDFLFLNPSLVVGLVVGLMEIALDKGCQHVTRASSVS